MATWCAACKRELPQLRSLRTLFDEDQVAMFGVPIDAADDSKKLQEFNNWKELDETNYHLVKNFHQNIPEKWPALEMIKAENIEELIKTLPKVKHLHISTSRRRMKNSRNLARLRALFKS